MAGAGRGAETLGLRGRAWGAGTGGGGGARAEPEGWCGGCRGNAGPESPGVSDEYAGSRARLGRILRRRLNVDELFQCHAGTSPRSKYSGVYPLSNFGTWTETGATVTEGSTSGVISSFTDDQITMINSSGQTKALPGALNGSGNGFSVTWKRAS